MSRRAVAAFALLCAACVTKEERKQNARDAGGNDAAAVAVVEAGVDAEPPKARVPTILVLGDSHTYGQFGQRLHERLAAEGTHAVVSQAAGGATTETYLEEKPEALVGYRMRESARGEHVPRETAHGLRGPLVPLDALLAKHDPDIVVVALGTNRPRAPVTDSGEALLKRLVRERGRSVLWVGPPAIGADRSEALVASLRAAVGRFASASFIDSTRFNAGAPLPPDNPHFGPNDARRWADVVFAQMHLRADDGGGHPR